MRIGRIDLDITLDELNNERALRLQRSVAVAEKEFEFAIGQVVNHVARVDQLEVAAERQRVDTGTAHLQLA